MTCGICSNETGNRVHHAREMMYGTREAFDYLECDSCGCVQLADQPADMGPYYPSDYYSYTVLDAESQKVSDRVLRRLRAELALRTPLSRLKQFPMTPHLRWLDGFAYPSSRMIDVGSGSGHNLLALRREGFRKLEGFDPYLPAGTEPADLPIRRTLPDGVDGLFDVAMMHHAFEHVADPISTLRMLSKLIRPNGSILLRIPLADSYAWREYGVDWVQLDAPRHFWLHTECSLEKLVRRAGLHLVGKFRDSTGFGLWGSELYRRNISLGNGAEVFTRNELSKFEHKAQMLNIEGAGDQGGFWLRKLPSGR